MFKKLLLGIALISMVSCEDNEFQKFMKDRMLEAAGLSDSVKSTVCQQCKEAVQSMQNYTKTDFTEWFKIQFDENCPTFQSENFCKGMTLSYSTSFSEHLFGRLFDPEDLCARLGACDNIYTFLKVSDFITDVMADKLSTAALSDWNSQASAKVSTNSNFKILQLTDVHVDLEYSAGSNAFCSDPFCCRAENGLAADPTQGAQYWGTQARCDIPLVTIDNMLSYNLLTTFIIPQINPDVIIWNGDTIAHDVWNQQESTQSLAQKRITEKIVAALPNAKLYPIFGNHEAFPSDQYDIFGSGSQWLKDESAAMWQNSLSAAAIASLKLNGYYSELNTALNLRFIALNTQTCDSLNFFLMDNVTDPNQHLVWLRAQFKDAETNHQYVYLFGHIPPGDIFCVSSWSRRLSVLTDRYKHLVKGLFFGHTHYDHLQHFISEVDQSVLHTVFIAPSTTTYSFQNPSFRVYDVQGSTNKILDYTQYRMDLAAANAAGASATDFWITQYSFKSQYGLTSMEPTETYRLATILEDNEAKLRTYITNYYGGSESLSEAQLSDLDNILFGSTVEKYYVCGIKHAIFDDYYDCIGTIAQLRNHDIIVFRVLEDLTGDWRLNGTNRTDTGTGNHDSILVLSLMLIALIIQ